jgi:hypothetical protein
LLNATKCDYITSSKKDFNKHTETMKHTMLVKIPKRLLRPLYVLVEKRIVTKVVIIVTPKHKLVLHQLPVSDVIGAHIKIEHIVSFLDRPLFLPCIPTFFFFFETFVQFQVKFQNK